MARALAYTVVDTPMGPFSIGASESAIHEAFFGKASCSFSPNMMDAEHPVLALVRISLFSVSFVQNSGMCCP